MLLLRGLTVSVAYVRELQNHPGEDVTTDHLKEQACVHLWGLSSASSTGDAESRTGVGTAAADLTLPFNIWGPTSILQREQAGMEFKSRLRLASWNAPSFIV